VTETGRAPLRILQICSFVPYPPDSGGKLVAFHHLSGLARKGHRVALLAPLRREGDSRSIAELGRIAKTVGVDVRGEHEIRRVARGLVHGDSIRIARHRFAKVEERLDPLLDSFRPGLVILDSLFTSYLIDPIRRLSPALPVVLLEHNAESLLVRRFFARSGILARIAGRIEVRRIERTERRALLAADRVIALSNEDRREMLPLAPEARIAVVPPGARVYPREVIPLPSRPRSALFLGSFRWPMNRDAALWLARSILPLVRARIPDAEIVLAGEGPTREILALHAPEKGIRVAGRVEDAAAAVRECALSVVPIRAGGGVRLKILEALANERPVVSTTVGCEGLPFRNGETILVADTPEAFADAAVQLLENSALASSIARRGRELVEKNFAWERIIERVEEILYETIERGTGRGA